MNEGFGTRFLLKGIALEWIIFGIGGLQQHSLLGLELTPVRCAVALLGAAGLLLLSNRAPLGLVRGVCVALTLLFGGVAWAGFTGALTFAGDPTGVGLDPTLRVLCKAFPLARNDQILHAILAGLFLTSAIAPVSRPQATARQETNS